MRVRDMLGDLTSTHDICLIFVRRLTPDVLDSMHAFSNNAGFAPTRHASHRGSVCFVKRGLAASKTKRQSIDTTSRVQSELVETLGAHL